MNKVVRSLAILLTTFFLASQCIAAEAVVIALSGKAQIVRAGKTLQAHTGIQLQQGDILTVEQGEANLITSGGKLETVPRDSRYTVKGGAKQNKGAGLNQRLLASLSDAAGDHEGPSVMGMVRGIERTQPGFPRNTAIFAQDLRFSWTSEADLEGMRFELKKRNPRFSFSQKLSDGSRELLYPESAPALEAGVLYYWKVEGYNMLTGEPAETSLVWFKVLPAGEERKVQQEIAEIAARSEAGDEVKVVLRVGVYASRELYSNALRELKTALKENPDSPVFQSLLSAMERKIGI